MKKSKVLLIFKKKKKKIQKQSLHKVEFLEISFTCYFRG